MQPVICKPHGNHKVKSIDTQNMERKTSKHSSTENHQIRKEERRRKETRRITKCSENN